VEPGALTVVVVVMLDALLARVLSVPPMVVAPVMADMGDLEAGEEDGRDDEYDAGHDHDPGRESVEPIGFDNLGRWHGGDGGRRGWGFRCFAHTWNDA
jgi:hypothetical protein